MSSKTSNKKAAHQHKEETGSARVTLSVDPNLLKVVDRYASGVELSRSAVFEQALMLWYEKLQEEADREFYSRESEDPEVKSWGKVAAKAARSLWND